MKVATIDIGTNTVLLLVAETRGDELVASEELAIITRLGEGVDKTRTLAPAAVERTRAALAQCKEIVGRHHVERIGVVGTSALRDAGGSSVLFDEVHRMFGVPLAVIAGVREAKLAFAGATQGLALPQGDAAIVFDIGGGSTEIVAGTIGGESLDHDESFDIGSVRLTERLVCTDPPSVDDLQSLRETIARTLSTLPRLPRTRAPIGVAGTVTTLAAISRRMTTYAGSLVHGMQLTRHEVERVVAELAAMPLASREQVPGLEPKRADVIVAGGLIVLGILDALGAPELIVSDRGVRWGLAAELSHGTSALPSVGRA